MREDYLGISYSAANPKPRQNSLVDSKMTDEKKKFSRARALVVLTLSLSVDEVLNRETSAV